MPSASIGPNTKAFVIGHPIAHSLSPVLQGHWLNAAGIDGDYTALDVAPDDLPHFVFQARDADIAGFNVTLPHKEAIMAHLDKVAPMAQDIGAVNTVVRSPAGQLTGFNTDGLGMMAHLKAVVPDWPIDRPILVIGGGGAARAAVAAARTTMAPFIMLTNRTRERAEVISQDIGIGRVTVVDWENRDDAVAGAGLIINATSLGMAGAPPLEVNLGAAAADSVVYDMVYRPLKTPLLAAAEARGLRTVDGLGMLIHQGAAAFKLWFKDMPDTGTATRSLLQEALSR